MNGKMKWTICFALLCLLLFSAAGGAAWEGGEARPAVVVFSQDAGPEEMREAIAGVEGVEVLWGYDALFPGAAVEADAAALDALHFPEVVGCIAGDDTVMCAVRTVDDTIILMDKLKKLLEG